MKANRYTLYTPGPVDVPEDILQCTSEPIVYHRDTAFGDMVKETADGLRKILYTNSRIFFFSSSGTGAMEATCTNVLSRTDRPIVAICGKFGHRWLELCNAFGVKPVVIQEDYGKSLDPAKLEHALKQSTEPPVIFMTLTETSTGALNDVKTCGDLAKQHSAFLVVDGVAGIGADPCPQDEWNIDVIVCASQKALMSPPGIAFISINERTFVRTKTSDLPKYYFDLTLYEKFRSKNQTPWTPALSIFNGFRKGVSLILEKGMESTFASHKKMAEYVRKRVTAMGFEIFSEHPSNALTVIKMPHGVDSTSIIREIKEKYGILFANGQAELRGTIIRIGHMGNYTVKKLGVALDALEQVMSKRR